MDNTTNTLAEQSKLRRLVNSYGVPRLIITGFLLLMFILAPVAGVDFATQITNVINRFSWNAIMVLAMVPMIHSGCGLNFGLPLGIISGLLGATLSIEFGFTGGMSFLMESKKLLNLFQTLAAMSGNSTLQTMGDLSKNYDGVRIGLDTHK